MNQDSVSDDMATKHLSTIWQKALTTFSSKSDVFHQNLEQLTYLFNKTKSSHVNLHPMFMQESTWNHQAKAPMTYIHVYNNDTVTIGMFILKQNTKLPLHDHPHMHGLLKVIAGQVKVQSYSINTDKTTKYSALNQTNEGILPLTVVAEKMDAVIADSDSKCCVLDPNKGNIHEVESLNGPAAFIDILSPPYETYLPELGERKCSYFRVLKELEPGLFVLEETDIPKWFWSDTSPYMGPTVI